jgi:hypothetical protein
LNISTKTKEPTKPMIAGEELLIDKRIQEKN